MNTLFVCSGSQVQAKIPYTPLISVKIPPFSGRDTENPLNKGYHFCVPSRYNKGGIRQNLLKSCLLCCFYK